MPASCQLGPDDMTSSANDASFPASYARSIVELCARWDVGEGALLRGIVEHPESLSDPSVRLPANTYRRLVRRAIELTREPGLAVWMGLHMRVSSHGFLGFAAMTAKTVRDGALNVPSPLPSAMQISML